MRLVKRRRALVETNLPRYSQLELIDADERQEWTMDALLPALPFNIGPIVSPCLEKFIHQVAAQRRPDSAPPVAERARPCRDTPWNLSSGVRKGSGRVFGRSNQTNAALPPSHGGSVARPLHRGP